MLGSRNKRRLLVWSGKARAEESPPELRLDQVSYAPPNLDLSRKQCANCMFWLGGDVDGREGCFLFDVSVIVTADMVCNNHMFGDGLAAALGGIHPNFQPLDPAFAGLVQTSEGTACEVCRHFQATEPGYGMCRMTYDSPGANATVEALGCCCAWEE